MIFVAFFFFFGLFSTSFQARNKRTDQARKITFKETYIYAYFNAISSYGKQTATESIQLFIQLT